MAAMVEPARASRPARRAVVVTAAAAPQPVYGAAPFTPAPPRTRPVGVLLLSILQFLTAAVFVFGGIMLLIGAAIGGFFLQRFDLPTWLQSGVALLAALLAIVTFVVATLVLLLALGTLRGRAWAWTTNLVLGIIGLVNAVFELIGVGGSRDVVSALLTALFGLAFQALILWYLYTPGVKAYFGKAHVRAPWQRGDPRSA